MTTALSPAPAAAPKAASMMPGMVGPVLALVTLGFYILVGFVMAAHTHNRLDPGGAPMFFDFAAFYQAAGFADHGHAAIAYDDTAMDAALKTAFPGASVRLPWNYPPSFQLALTPFAWLPYVASFLVFSAALYAAYALTIRKLFSRGALPLALLAPGVAVNVLVGQNGALTAALMGAGALLVRSRPILAGALLGALTYKPHFALLIPIVLLAGREWRAFAASAVTALAMIAISAGILGPDAWVAFAHKAMHPAAVLTTSSSAWRNVPSMMILARTLGLDPALGAALHWTIAALAIAGACWTWIRTKDAKLRAGALATATLLVTPYLRSYDLVLLVLPMAALADGERSLGEQAAIAVAWLLPAVLLLSSPPIQYGALVSLAMLGLVLRRVALAKASAPQASPLASPSWSPKPL